MLPVALNRSLRALRLFGLRGGGAKMFKEGNLGGKDGTLTVSFT
jgi:hypothetical protein